MTSVVRCRRIGMILAACVACVGVPRQPVSAAPSPSPVPSPIAFSARAHASVSGTAQSTAMSGTAQFGIAQRGDLTRIDLLAFKTDATAVPPLSLTLVVDRRASTLTVWNDTAKTYYVQPFSVRLGTSASPSPAPSPSPSAGASPRPPNPVSPFKRLEVLDLSLHLIGHTTTIGVATTGLALDLNVKDAGDPAVSHLTAMTQLADDFAAFPMTLDVAVEPGTAPFHAKLSYAVDEFTRGVPAAARFAIPVGYAKASSLLAVVFGAMPPKPK